MTWWTTARLPGRTSAELIQRSSVKLSGMMKRVYSTVPVAGML